MPELEHAEVVNFVILLAVGNCTMKRKLIVCSWFVVVGTT